MRHLATLAFCLALVQPALAQPLPNAEHSGNPARTFVLRNDAGTRITGAQVVTTDGRTVDLLRGLGPLTNAEGRDVLVPEGACIRSVRITLQNGKHMTARAGNDCSRSIVAVTPEGIHLTSSAVGARPG